LAFRINKLSDFSSQGLHELRMWMEIWMRQKSVRGVGGVVEWEDVGVDCSGSSGDYNGYVLSLADLIGYWRLGEGASPWQDTSPFADAHLSKTAHGAAMNDDVVGALPVDQDDGAVEFTGSAFVQGDILDPAVTTRFQFVNEDYTVSCWLKMNSDSGTGSFSQIVGTYSPSNGGWTLGAFGGQVIGHQRYGVGGSFGSGVSGPGIAADEWIFIVATYDPSTGHQLFYNAVRVATDPGTSVVPNFNMHVGAMATGGPVYGALDGSVDELAIWNRVLTNTEIQGLYAQGT
jgi:hypothetical protein